MLRKSENLREDRSRSRWGERAAWLLLALCVPGCAWRKDREQSTARVLEARQLALRGCEAWQQGDAAHAEQLFENALASCPVEERAHRYYAELLWERGQQGEALEHLRQAAKLSDNAVDVLVRIGHMRLEQGELAHAFAWSERAVSRDHTYPPAWALRAHVLHLQGRFEEALLSCHRALNLNPDDGKTEYRTVLLYRQLDRPRRALSVLNAIAARHSQAKVPVEVLDQQAWALASLRRGETAAIRLAEAASRAPTTERLCRLCRLQRSLGQNEDARATIQLAMAKDPHSQAAQALWRALSGSENPVQQASGVGAGGRDGF